MQQRKQKRMQKRLSKHIPKLDHLKPVQSSLSEYFESTNRFCQQAKAVQDYLVRVESQVSDPFLTEAIQMYGWLSQFPYSACYDRETKKFLGASKITESKLTEVLMTQIIDLHIEPHYRTHSEYSAENAKRLTAMIWITLYYPTLQNFLKSQSEIIDKLEFTQQESEALKFLIAPVQRLPRVELLFKSILDGMTESDWKQVKAQEQVQKLKSRIQKLIKHLNFFREITDTSTDIPMPSLEEFVRENVILENLKKLTEIDISSSTEISLFGRNSIAERVKKHPIYKKIDEDFKRRIDDILALITSESCSYQVVKLAFNGLKVFIKMNFLLLLQELNGKKGKKGLDPKIFDAILKRFDELMQYFKKQLESKGCILSKYPSLSSIEDVICNENMLAAIARLAKKERDPDITADIHVISSVEWKKVDDKQGGVHDAGELGGVYEDMYKPGRKVLFKRPSTVEVMVEYVTGKFQQMLNPDAPELFARVELAYPLGTQIPDESDENIYLASEFFPNCNSLHNDAYNAFSLPMYKPLDKEGLVRPAKRNRYLFGMDDNITLMIQQGRYRTLPRLTLTAAMTGDPDRHCENILVVPVPGHKEDYVIVKAKDKSGNTYEEKVYQKAQAVNIDFGGGFSGGYDGRLHMKDVFRYLIHDGPPNYTGQYPDAILSDQWMLQELVRKSNFPPIMLQAGIGKVIDELARYFSRKALFEFAKRIGLIALNSTKDIDSEIIYLDKLTLINDIKAFFFENLQTCLVDVRHHAENLKVELNTDEEQYAEWNRSAISFYTKHYKKTQPNTDELRKSNELQSSAATEKDEGKGKEKDDGRVKETETETVKVEVEEEKDQTVIPFSEEDDALLDPLPVADGWVYAHYVVDGASSERTRAEIILSEILTKNPAAKMSTSNILDAIDILSDISIIGIGCFIENDEKHAKPTSWWPQLFISTTGVQRARIYDALLQCKDASHPLNKLISIQAILANKEDKILHKYIAYELTQVLRDFKVIKKDDSISSWELSNLLKLMIHRYLKNSLSNVQEQTKISQQINYIVNDTAKKINKGNVPDFDQLKSVLPKLPVIHGLVRH